MARASELIDFRRAFWWLLGGVLVPSVALVAFGVVAVANERAAVERRLAAEYGDKLRALQEALLARLDRAAELEVARVRRRPETPELAHDRLVERTFPLSGIDLDPAAQELGSRAGDLPDGAHRLLALEHPGERRTFALLRAAPPEQRPALFAAELDLRRLSDEVPQLAAQVLPRRERATFRLIALPDRSTTFETLRRLVSEVAAGARSAAVARLPLAGPLDGFLLTAELPGDDPVAEVALRNRTLYIALLALLYTSIGVGFGLTLRELYRAARLSRLKTDFVANISHELRTPLTSVRLFAETLQSGRASSPEEVQECLDLLAREAARLGVLVERLLDWSRLESGSRVLRQQPIAVEELFEEVAQIFRAQQLGAGYQVEREPGLPRVNVDREAMAQVVLNLLHNAVKYTGADKRIVLRARRARKQVAIEVQDNGVGVRPHERKRIFERFYRSDDLLSRRTEGTGLGLAIAKRIVDWHDGTIEVQSREGEGSTFRVLLPAVPVPAQATLAGSANRAAPAGREP